MSSRLKFLRCENEMRTSACWLNTLSIATHERQVRTLRAWTRRLSDYLNHTLGPETYGNYRTSSNDLSSCAKPRIFRWMKAGCPNSRRTEKRRASFISPRRWQLKKKKSSKQPCENAKGGCPGRRVRPPNWESYAPRWNRGFSHSKLTRIASEL